jgi:hypothetical protein
MVTYLDSQCDHTGVCRRRTPCCRGASIIYLCYFCHSCYFCTNFCNNGPLLITLLLQQIRCEGMKIRRCYFNLCDYYSKCYYYLCLLRFDFSRYRFGFVRFSQITSQDRLVDNLKIRLPLFCITCHFLFPTIVMQ